MVESESLVRNEVMVTDQVLSRSNGLIKKYSIISESEGDGVYSVNIRAVVSAVRLKKALDAIGLTALKMGKPRITLLVSERSGEGSPGSSGSRNGYGVVENRIHDVLIRKGFDFIDSTALGIAKENAALWESDGSSLTAASLAKFAKSGNAEIIIVGSANSRSCPAISGTSIHPCQATVSVRALNLDNGEVLASHAAQATAPHINTAAGEAEALGKASEEAAENVSRQIIANWKGKVEGARTVRLVVSGIDGYEDLKSLKKTVKEQIEEVEEVWERSFEASTARIDLEVTSSARNLADRLSSLSVHGKPLRITSFTANVVEVTIGKRKAK
jgi:hypothetical protein